MSFRPGTHIGPYEVIALIGRGGMGEVWRAHHTALKRDDALKVLPDAFVSDTERLARFRREAQVLASLNHPNIAHVYGLEQADGVQALVMELVEGPTLADRIEQGPIPVDEALPIAKQISEALEAAHEQGIVHRDLKPANIKVREDGTVKILDFGLAKALEPPVLTNSNAMQSPTITTPAMMTGVGMILGTAAYMSPEQAKGKPADKRSDLWAFGCVVYEMLTGTRAYAGDDISETLAVVLRAEPDWTLLPTETPEPVRRLLRRCLVKDRRARIGDASIARIEVDEALTSSTVDDERRQDVPPFRIHLIWASVVAVLAAVVGALTWGLRSPSVPSEMHVDITTPPTTDLTSLAISPDGRKITFAAKADGRSQLWVRWLDSGSTRPLAGTREGTLPFWSPDSRSIGFFADAKLKRLDIDGGSPHVLANAGVGLGGAWHPNGSILFAPTPGSPILSLPSTGGEPIAVTRFAPGQITQTHPQLLPDGRHFLYHSNGRPEVAGIYIGQVAGGDTTRLLDADAAVHEASGHLLFIRQGTLYAQPLDLRRLELVGSPNVVAEQIAMSNNRSAALSASLTGSIVYRTGSAGLRQFAWLDRSGTEIERVGAPDNLTPRNPSMSPNGSRVVLTRISTTSLSDIWLLDTPKGLLTRFTADEVASYPIWAPDGQQIAFTSSKGTESDIYLKPAARAGNSELLYAAPGFNNPLDWSRDGRFLLFRHVQSGKNGYKLWALPMSGDRKAFPVVQSNFDERDGQFSPDGKWIAYQSDESGQFEIYVQRFPVGGGKERISTDGGAQVRWRADGKELFYIALDDRLMAVPITLPADGERVKAGSPAALFTTRIGGAVQGIARQQYVVGTDGQRFLMNTVPEDAPSPITLILNWNGNR